MSRVTLKLLCKVSIRPWVKRLPFILQALIFEVMYLRFDFPHRWFFTVEIFTEPTEETR